MPATASGAGAMCYFLFRAGKNMTHMAVEIHQDDLSGEQTKALLRLHLAGVHANSPPGHVFALDLSGLKAQGVTVWSAWVDEKIAGIGALRDLGHGAGEVKSMRTHPDFLRRGVAAVLLDHIIAGCADAACTS